MKHDIYVFDAFWTLIKPVNRLKDELRKEKISISKDLWTIIMTTPESVIAIIEQNFDISDQQRQIFKQAIAQEIHEWELYDDVVPTLEELHRMQKEIHLISNLWYEYASLVYKLLSKYINTDNIHLSCYDGLRKPNPSIYNIWNTNNKQIMMIWDSIKNDYDAPKLLWRDAKIIDRNNKIAHPNKISSLFELRWWNSSQNKAEPWQPKDDTIITHLMN